MISIIVPIYNVERYLRQCIDSILNQTYRDIEILLIDDGSPDRCGKICDEYAKKDNRISVFHTENKGLSAARNLGLREAKGEYIGFVDSDDWIEPDMYKILFHNLEEVGADISTCGIRDEYAKRKSDRCIADSSYQGAEAIRALLCNNHNFAWNKLYKRACWTGLFFPEKHAYEDIATIYKVFLKAHSVSFISKPLYHYRMRENSIIHTRSRENILDYWNAFYGRHLYLCTLSVFKDDPEINALLEKQIAFAAIRTWRWILSLPLEQRNYVLLCKVSSFVKNTFPLFGKKKWGICLRLCIIFPRYPNKISFAIMHAMNSFIIPLKRTKTPFPS